MVGTLKRPLTSSVVSGQLFGLIMSNNGTDATNDIDIAAGVAADSTNAVTMTLASGLTKRLDANWAVGTNQGMRYSGAAIANTTYHIYLGQSSSGTVDIYADPSATIATVLGHWQAETGGSAYSYIRRIGSIIRSGAAIVAFSQMGDEFLRKVPSLDVDVTTLSTSATLYTLSVPTGIQVGAMLDLAAGKDEDVNVLITSPDQTDSDPATFPYTVFNDAGNSDLWGGTGGVWRTNTSAQVRARSSDDDTWLVITTRGWIDTRGRLA